MRTAIVLFILANAALACQAAGPRDVGPIAPPDFKIVAGFGNGSIAVTESIYSWDITITGTGEAIIEAFRGQSARPERHKAELPPGAVKQILAALDRSEFFTLPAEIEGKISDSPAYTLEVTRSGKHHRVWLYAPAGIHDKAFLKRFLVVWETIFRYVEPPSGKAPLEHLRANS
ncbi:MAG: hypothetical protein ABIT38_11270 [Gemmatimonadaceae bacterium]